ncbi:Murein DD-endopeptidase MepM and murein hydrolase activator NlpD, contain LysM domain [Streptomyces sp. TverLS-915]|uniref:M23 family metallopeptidase n=1 Tax=Streptomyces sp. TverLS-915 TaxID=1839763 RepID=UPI00081F02A6|nr:M23 family metallopeptidase [Streptomyces sp. TverLS-915]SCD48084.1 Murein DD-endopeptidase MepM and murein hydrolase activator NlpD, contain LysM domain [Streptomyces sp. TverLS-915]
MSATANRRSFTRRLALLGTTGAAVVALPLTALGGAHAASPAKDATYTVKAGDTLIKIAKKEKVSGGWKKLYEQNKGTVGANPGIIKPGSRLVVKKAATPAPAAKKATRGSGWTAPVDGVKGSGYGRNGSLWSHGHTGADFPVNTGTPVKSVAAGTVVTAGWGGAYGNQIVIKHADGHYSQYAHLSAFKVSAGQSVGEGQQIAVSGATGNVTGPHLHFEVRTGPDYGSDVNPITFLAQHGVNA